MIDQLTKESFADHVGETFQLHLGPEQALALTLVEVSGFGESPAGKWGVPENRSRTEPFSIVFRGPHDPPLNQMMYHVEHDQLGSIPGLFLVPVAAGQEGRYYEAIFN